MNDKSKNEPAVFLEITEPVYSYSLKRDLTMEEIREIAKQNSTINP